MEDAKRPGNLRHIYCKCGVKVAILEGSLKLRPGAVILCADCVPVRRDTRPSEDATVEKMRQMFGMK